MSLRYMDQVLAGTAQLDNIDDFVSAWHDSKTDTQPLSDFLGMTREEYQNWVADPDTLPHIVEIRRMVAAARLEMTHAVAKITDKIN